MNFEKICRCCLMEKREFKNIHSYVEIDGKQEIIADIFMNTLNEEILSDDELPKNICTFCLTTLHMTYSFKKVVEKSKNTLLKYIEDHATGKDTQQETMIETKSNAERFVPNTHVFSPPPDRRSRVRNLECEKFYYCTACNQKFQQSLQLYNHCHTHHSPKSTSGRTCDYCNEKFPDFRSLLFHRRKHLSPYVCPICCKGFMHLEIFKKHTNFCTAEITTGDPKPKRVMCHICGKPYPTTYINIHMLIHGKGTLVCKYCGKTFKQPCGLNSHILWNHVKEKVHHCKYCKLAFITASAKNTHIRVVHKKEKKATCHECGKTYFNNFKLKKHMESHIGEKGYVCEHCDKMYRTQRGLNLHIKCHDIQYLED